MKRAANTSNLHAHLLRNLGNAGALRGNPLVAHLFVSFDDSKPRSAHDLQTLELIRRTIDKTCDAWLNARNAKSRLHALRQVHILRRCDLDGELHSVIAAEMGLSMRHFYRERNEAIAGIIAMAAERFALMAPTAIHAVDPFALELTRLHAMRPAGLHREGVERAQQLIDELPDADRREEVAALAAHLLIDEGLVDHAQHLLDEFGRPYAMSDADDHNALRRFARWSLVRTELYDRLGQVDALRHATDQASHLAERLRLAVPTPERDDVLVRVSLARARKLLTEHDTLAAKIDLQQAKQALEMHRRPPAHLFVDYHFATAEVALASGDLATASAAAGAVLDASTHHGYIRGAFGALVIFVYIAWQRGELVRAFALLQQCIDIAHGTPQYFAGVAHLIWANILADTKRNGGKAIEHARAARAVLPRNRCSDWAISLAIEAYGLELQGAYEDAMRVGEEALRLQRRSGDVRYLGSTLGVMADCYEHLRRRREAVRSIEEAVDLLYTYGHPLALGRTYRAAARITGDPHFTRAADELAINMTSA